MSKTVVHPLDCWSEVTDRKTASQVASRLAVFFLDHTTTPVDSESATQALEDAIDLAAKPLSPQWIHANAGDDAIAQVLADRTRACILLSKTRTLVVAPVNANEYAVVDVGAKTLLMTRAPEYDVPLDEALSDALLVSREEPKEEPVVVKKKKKTPSTPSEKPDKAVRKKKKTTEKQSE